MVVEITKKFYVSPREAFDIVGKESFGQDWDSSFIDKPDASQFGITLKNLYRAFDSGEVEIFTTYGNDSPRALQPINTRGHFFTIELERNVVMNEWTIPHGEFCEIHAEQLRDFIRRHDPTRPIPSPGRKSQTACEEWLVELIKTKDPLAPKSELIIQAKRKFETGPTYFNKAWKAAIKKTGRSDLSKPGRPKIKI